MNRPCSFWLTVWPVAQTMEALTHHGRLKFWKKLLISKLLMIQIFIQQVFLPVHYPRTLWINQCTQPISSLIPLVIQSCPSLYPALEDKATIYMFILPSFTLAGFQKHGKQHKQKLRKLLKWSWSSQWFLNTTELMGNGRGAGSSGCDKREKRVKKEGEGERIFNLKSQLCPFHLRSLEMKIISLGNTHRLSQKAADNYKHEAG